MLSVASVALADTGGYRQGQRFEEHPPLDVPFGVSAKGVFLPPGSYVVRVRAGRLIFADAELRQVRLRVPCRMSVTQSTFEQPSIDVSSNSRGLYVRYSYRAWSCFAMLARAQAPDTTTQTRTSLEHAKMKRNVSSGVFEEADTYELVTRILEQRAREFRPCLLRAERQGSRLKLDGLTRCACGFVESWRFPPLDSTIKVALRVVPFPFGIAFQLEKDRRLKDCRAWIGRGPVDSGVEVDGLWLEVLDEGYQR